MPKTNNKRTLCPITDLYFAAFLSTIDIEMVNVEEKIEHGRNKLYFIFKIPENTSLTLLKAKFFGGSGTVDASKYAQKLRSLKSMCF